MQALCKAEDESDAMAATLVKAEQKAELAEFDETIPWDEREAEARKEQEEMSRAEMELAMLDKEVRKAAPSHPDLLPSQHPPPLFPPWLEGVGLKMVDVLLSLWALVEEEGCSDLQSIFSPAVLCACMSVYVCVSLSHYYYYFIVIVFIIMFKFSSVHYRNPYV